jgi:hypothetical protein
MTRNVLLLGRRGIIVDDVQRQLQMPDIQLYGGTGIEDLRSTFARTNVDHVIMGAGIDLQTRLEIVRETFSVERDNERPYEGSGLRPTRLPAVCSVDPQRPLHVLSARTLVRMFEGRRDCLAP